MGFIGNDMTSFEARNLPNEKPDPIMDDGKVYQDLSDEEVSQLRPNRRRDNDNVRLCIAWRRAPVVKKNETTVKGTDLFETCNFFIRNWGESRQQFDGVK